MTRWLALFLVLPFALAASAQDAPELAKATNLEKLNTPQDETDPYLLPDGNTMLYASKASGQFVVNIRHHRRRYLRPGRCRVATCR